MRLFTTIPGISAAVLMPCHLHLQHARDVTVELGHVASAYARWRNHHRGTTGRVWSPVPPPTWAKGTTKIRRDLRYMGLNPSRDGLVTCPLGWPFSTHRDAVGLAIRPVRPAVADVVRHHAYVSGDPKVAVGGTELPNGRLDLQWNATALPLIRDAVSALTRTLTTRMSHRGPARTLYIRAARTLTSATAPEIGASVSASASAVRSVRPVLDRDVQLVARVVGDPRFAPLYPHDLTGQSSWQAYCRRRGIRG